MLHYVQLSLANRLWVGAITTSKSCGVTVCDRPAPYPWSCSVSWCLAEGYENKDQRAYVVWEIDYFLH